LNTAILFRTLALLCFVAMLTEERRTLHPEQADNSKGSASALASRRPKSLLQTPFVVGLTADCQLLKCARLQLGVEIMKNAQSAALRELVAFTEQLNRHTFCGCIRCT
jgi:hypothetical protein